MKHDFIGKLLSVGRVALAPVVAHGIGKDVSVAVERGAGDGASDGRIPLQTMLSILIPEVEGAVTAGGAEGAMDGVESDVVDGVDVVDVALAGWGLAMAFETKVGARVLLLDVLYSTAALDTANGKSGGIDETVDHPGLPFERRLHGLVERGRAIEINDVDVAICRPNDQKLALYVHGIHSLLTFNRRNGGGLPQIPVFDCLVPRTGDEKGRVSCGVWNHVAASNGTIVSRDLRCRAARNIEHTGSFISTRSDDFASILHKSVARSVQCVHTHQSCSIPVPNNSSKQELHARKEPFLHSVPAH